MSDMLVVPEPAGYEEEPKSRLDIELEQANHAFRFQQDNCFELFKYKNSKYGNAIKVTGVLGTVVEIIGAVGRLPFMVLKNPTHGRDVRNKLIDVLRDIHNYATIALMMIEDGNWEGV